MRPLQEEIAHIVHCAESTSKSYLRTRKIARTIVQSRCWTGLMDDPDFSEVPIRMLARVLTALGEAEHGSWDIDALGPCFCVPLSDGTPEDDDRADEANRVALDTYANTVGDLVLNMLGDWE